MSTRRQSMHALISDVQYYVMFEVLEPSWNEFECKLSHNAANDDLDSIIAGHENYLNSVIEKALLGTKSQVLQTEFTADFRFRTKVQITHVQAVRSDRGCLASAKIRSKTYRRARDESAMGRRFWRIQGRRRLFERRFRHGRQEKV